ncbi:MAG: hypothetical protein U1F08_06880 [Steroidobacteraceae bacterium]
MRKTVLAACALAVSLAASAAQAQDTLAVPAGAAPATSGPQRGLTMAEVESRYGAPASKLDAIGQPPITRWVYPGFVVYFEYDRVIHSVDKADPAAR